LGLKGPRAAQWLLDQGVELPVSPNTWRSSEKDGDPSEARLVARLGAGEFFLEEGSSGDSVRAIEAALAGTPAGVYPVLREDAAFCLRGDGTHDVLAQVCSVNFAQIPAAAHSVVMTLMIGVAVLVVLEEWGGERRYRIWCDPSFGLYLGSTLATVVMENGGKFTGTI
jgi:sarcosine oxidase subunit gamma